VGGSWGTFRSSRRGSWGTFRSSRRGSWGTFRSSRRGCWGTFRKHHRCHSRNRMPGQSRRLPAPDQRREQPRESVASKPPCCKGSDQVLKVLPSRRSGLSQAVWRSFLLEGDCFASLRAWEPLPTRLVASLSRPITLQAACLLPRLRNLNFHRNVNLFGRQFSRRLQVCVSGPDAKVAPDPRLRSSSSSFASSTFPAPAPLRPRQFPCFSNPGDSLS
jgi:hypothetical protein